ncbi:hypothetical protein B0H19DRAFT_1259674 [Mycena capillaripes]|nr:hypothetical protein B0H19DRAFT_1259674 [Mycena capillaripes]
MEFRRLNAGGYWFLFTAQYALDIHLTGEELVEPKLVMCETLCLDAAAMEYDVASYEKELAAGLLSANIVATLLEHGNYLSQRRRQKNTSAKKSPTGHSDDCRRYLRALSYIVSGNTWWSQHTKRYNISGHPVPRRVIHLEEVGDFGEP